MKMGHIKNVLALGLIAIVAGCLTDGPNKTGSSIVESRNLEVTRTLSSVTLQGFALDSFWTSDNIAEQPFTPLRTLWVGDQDGFSSSARYGFQFTRSPDDLDSLRMRITQLSITDEDQKKAFNREDTSSTLTQLVVRSFAYAAPDSIMEPAQIYFFQDLDSIDRYQERVANIGAWSVSALDIIDLDSVGAQENLATGSLKNLRDSLKAYGEQNLRASGDTVSRDTTFWIFTEVSVKDTSSSNNTMRRLSSDVRLEWREPGEGISTLAIGTFQRRNSGLNVRMSRVLNTHPDFQPFTSDPILLTGLPQGLEFSLDRQKILDAIRNQDPNFTHSAFDENTSQQFDNTYFVPYAEISFPVDSANVTQSGDYLLQFSALPWMDTVQQDQETDARIDLELGATPVASGLSVSSLVTDSVIDQINLQYYTKDDRYYFAVSYQDGELDADTVQIDTSKPTLYQHSARDPLGSLFQIEFLLEPQSSGGTLSVSSRTRITPVSSEALPRERYYETGSSKLTTQITNTMQLLLNRNPRADYQSYGFSLYANFLSGVIEDNSDVNDDFDNLLIPVFSKVPLKLEGGVLKADITIHYYKQ